MVNFSLIKWATFILSNTPRFLRYYGLLRPCAPHRYSHPRESVPWISPLAWGQQVPTFHTRAWSRVTPPLCRVPSGQAAGSRRTRPGITTLPGFDTVPTLSTRNRWFMLFVSAGPHLMLSRSTFCRDAHHPGSLPEQLTVVWSLPLPGGSEGPSLIPCVARLRLGGHDDLLSAPSWRTVVSVPYEFVAAPLQFFVQVVQDDVGQKRCIRPSLRGALFRAYAAAVNHDPGLEVGSYQLEYPLVLYLPRHPGH